MTPIMKLLCGPRGSLGMRQRKTCMALGGSNSTRCNLCTLAMCMHESVCGPCVSKAHGAERQMCWVHTQRYTYNSTQTALKARPVRPTIVRCRVTADGASYSAVYLFISLVKRACITRGTAAMPAWGPGDPLPSRSNAAPQAGFEKTLHVFT